MTAAELGPLESKTSRFPEVGMKNATPIRTQQIQVCLDTIVRNWMLACKAAVRSGEFSQQAKGFDLIETRRVQPLKLAIAVPVLPLKLL
jgi:hypothetical protein